MVFYERDGRLGGVHRRIGRLFGRDEIGIRLAYGEHLVRGGHLFRTGVVLLDTHRRVKIHDHTYNDTQHNLSHELGLFRNAVLVVFYALDVVIGETEGTEPQGGEDHQQDVNVVELVEQQHRYQQGYDDKDATHLGRVRLILLSGKAEVALLLATGLLPQDLNDGFTGQKRDEERHRQCAHRTERNIMEQPRTGEILSMKPIEKVI